MEGQFIFPVVESIKKRISVRTYDETLPLANEIKEKLQEFAASIVGPFGSKLRFKIIENDAGLKGSNIRLGTYGVIKGAKLYGVAVGKKGNMYT